MRTPIAAVLLFVSLVSWSTPSFALRTVGLEESNQLPDFKKALSGPSLRPFVPSAAGMEEARVAEILEGWAGKASGRTNQSIELIISPGQVKRFLEALKRLANLVNGGGNPTLIWNRLFGRVYLVTQDKRFQSQGFRTFPTLGKALRKLGKEQFYFSPSNCAF